jgi:hypothetical protein
MIERKKMEAICKEIEARLEAELGYRPAVVLFYTNEADGCSLGWITNVSRENGMMIARKAGEIMQSQVN